MDDVAYYNNLAPPPRDVPWPVRSQVLFGGFLNQFGWIFFGFGLIFVWVFGLMADFSPIYFALRETETAPGVVSDVEVTNASENDVPVYASHYSFRVERLETEYRGTSYTTGRHFSTGQAVTIEYLSNNPDISHIQGARGAAFGPWVLCIVIIFPLIGLSFMITGLIKGIKGNRLLAHGKIGVGVLKSKEPTGTKINNETVYKLTFEFAADNGQTYEAVARTHEPYALEDEPQEQLLYNPTNPAYAVMLDNLPGAPDIDELGHIQVADFGRSLRVLVLPVMVLIVHGTIFLGVLML